MKLIYKGELVVKECKTNCEVFHDVEKRALHLIDLDTSESISGIEDCPKEAEHVGIYWANLASGDYLVHYRHRGLWKYLVVESGRRLGLVCPGENPLRCEVRYPDGNAGILKSAVATVRYQVRVEPELSESRACACQERKA